jgi:hypothetical protein
VTLVCAANVVPLVLARDAAHRVSGRARGKANDNPLLK